MTEFVYVTLLRGIKSSVQFLLLCYIYVPNKCFGKFHPKTGATKLTANLGGANLQLVLIDIALTCTSSGSGPRIGGPLCSRGPEKDPEKDSEKETSLPLGPSVLLEGVGRSHAFLWMKIFEGQKK